MSLSWKYGFVWYEEELSYSTVLHINSYVSMFLFAPKQRQDKFFDIDNGRKTPTNNIDVVNLPACFWQITFGN